MNIEREGVVQTMPGLVGVDNVERYRAMAAAIELYAGLRAANKYMNMVIKFVGNNIDLETESYTYYIEPDHGDWLSYHRVADYLDNAFPWDGELNKGGTQEEYDYWVETHNTILNSEMGKLMEEGRFGRLSEVFYHHVISTIYWMVGSTASAEFEAEYKRKLCCKNCLVTVSEMQREYGRLTVAGYLRKFVNWAETEKGKAWWAIVATEVGTVEL